MSQQEQCNDGADVLSRMEPSHRIRTRIEQQTVRKFESSSHLPNLTLTVFHINDRLDGTWCALYTLSEIDIVKHHRDVERISDLLFLAGFVSSAHKLLKPLNRAELSLSIFRAGYRTAAFQT
jgi:hypothetical protein